ncbi:uncharacterized protein [Panulirus ornatus]|uniref:uncharacterized protein n=1 Tax=Panulirus ornatus TaxID=150431 RepID=UPI003A840653
MALKMMLLLVALAMVAEARPRYIAIPVEAVRLVRQVRSVPVYPQVQEHADGGEALLSDGSNVYERQSVGGYSSNDHVDYGAYTGGYGAFGWYSDHPVCVNCGYGYH